MSIFEEEQQLDQEAERLADMVRFAPPADATMAAPKSAVTGTISVPGEATRRASAAAVSVTKSVVLAFRTRMRMMLLLARLAAETAQSQTR